MIRYLLAALVLFLPLSAYSQPDSRWKFIDADDDRAIYFDTKRPINRKAEVRKAWVLTSHRELQDGARIGGSFQSSIYLYFVNCKDLTYHVPFHVFYKEPFAQGATVSSSGTTTAPPAQSYKSTIPGSWGETIVEAMCK